MYGAELRTYGLSAVVAVLLGAGIGFGWYYFADSAGATAMASAVAPSPQHDAPGPPLSCPPGPREVAVPDVPRLPVLSRPNNQPQTTHAKGAPRVTHAGHTSRTQQVPPPGRPDGGERNAL
jgi:hypothetical protein